MRKFAIAMMIGCLIVGVWAGPMLAQDAEMDGEGEGDGGPKVLPVEAYICSYNEGKGPADLAEVVANWNAWADDSGLSDYIGVSLTPFYYGADQEFDFIWLGASFTAAQLGRAHDNWIANGSESAQEWNELSTCSSHSNFAAIPFKDPGGPPPDSFVMAFSDCTIADGKSFDDVAPALAAWAEYKGENGATGGIWAFMPAYGGGGEEFDFKYVSTHASFEAQGTDWDQYAGGGYEKAGELFGGMIDCDSSRVYMATSQRRPTPPSEE